MKGGAGQLLAAVGGAGLVYLAGGVLVRAEVHRSGLPTDEVIAAIPRSASGCFPRSSCSSNSRHR